MSTRMKRQLSAAMRRDRRLILVQVLIMSLVATLLVRAAWMQVAELGFDSFMMRMRTRT